MSPPHLGPKLLMGGAWITTYNTTVSAGHYTSVPVYYNTTVTYDTLYTRSTSQNTVSWMSLGGEFGGFYITYATTWDISYPVSTSYQQQTYRMSNQWVDTSYSQQTWRETSW